jgi:hypothetical protein
MTTVPSAVAVASRCELGSGMKTSVPAGASIVSPSTTKVAAPATTT